MAESATSDIPPYLDISEDLVATANSFDDNQKVALLSAKWHSVHSYKFPQRYAAGRFRYLQPKYFETYPWLRYSVKADGVYCVSCALFCGSNPRSKILTKHPLTDWSNVAKILSAHGQSGAHLSSSEMADNFLAVMKGDKKGIDRCMSAIHNALVEKKNRLVLTSIVETIMLCGKQNIAMRGHEEDRSNFKALLNYRSKHDSVLKDHLQNCDPRSKYLSPDIQNEIISICGEIIREEIVYACNNAHCFGFIADEATDASTCEQMAICLRSFDENTNELREDFLGFAECQSTTGESLADAFLTELRQAGVNVDRMRGQGYDGAANMAGVNRGVQARIRAICPQAIYTHCKAHSLNLAIIHASREVYPRNMMDIVQTIAFSFNYSAKRLLRFQDQLANDDVSRAEMDRRSKLKSLCETRWAAKADALHTFLCSYRTVVASLEELAADYNDQKAAGYSRSIQDFQFLVTLVAVEHILSGLVCLSKQLQSKSCDLIEATSEAQVVVTMMQAERNDLLVWETLYDKAETLARDVDVVPCVPRHRGHQQNRPNAPAATPSDFWRKNMYLPFMDHLNVELTTRLLQGNERFKAQFLIPIKIEGLETVTQDIYEEFKADLECQDLQTFQRECSRWTCKWRESSTEDFDTLEKTLKVATRASYPNIRICLVILLTMPVSTASAERSFSVMRRVKSYLRSTMTTRRLSGLGLLNIYREKEIQAERVIDIFARRRERRLALIFRD